MAARLLQVLQFANVANGATVSAPHQLNDGARALTPDLIIPSAAGFTITADSIQVSVTNNTGGVASIDVLIWFVHTIARVLGAAQTTALPVNPFVASGGGSGGATVSSEYTFVFRPGSAFTGPVVWNDWASLYAALDAARTAAHGGQFTVMLDDLDIGIGASVIIPVGPYDLSLCQMIGPRIGEPIFTPVNVQIDEGTAISGLQRIAGIAFSGAIVTPPIQLVDNSVLIIDMCQLASPTIAGISGTSQIVIGDNCLINPGPTITADAGATINVYATGNGSVIAADAINSVAGTTNVTLSASGTDLHGPQPTTGVVTQLTKTRYWPSFDGAVQGADCSATPDEILLVDGAQTFTVTLPAISGGSGYRFRGRQVIIKEATGSGAGVITVTGDVNIDGAASTTMTNARECLVLLADDINSEWRVISR